MGPGIEAAPEPSGDAHGDSPNVHMGFQGCQYWGKNNKGCQKCHLCPHKRAVPGSVFPGSAHTSAWPSHVLPSLLSALPRGSLFASQMARTKCRAGAARSVLCGGAGAFT